MDSPEGRLSDRYEIVREIGRGRASVVYLARDALLDRDVAIKLVPSDRLSAEAEARFRHEARAIARMDHPAIVPIFDFGEHEGALFFVMPVFSGQSLRAVLASGPLEPPDAVEIVARVAEALDYCHARGVVHRAVRPEAIFVRRGESGVPRARVAGFAVASEAGGERDDESTDARYLSPEQLRGEPADALSDVFALGAVLYECLAGAPPSRDDAREEVGPLSGVDDLLGRIVLQALEREPERRHQSAGALAWSLGRWQELRTVREPAAPSPLPGFSRAPSPFVGREREVAALERHLLDVVEGENHFVLVSGEAGIGKTRLLAELRRFAAEHDVRIVEGRFFGRDRAFPYQGFCEVLHEHLADAAAEEWIDLAPDLVRLFPMLADVPALGAHADDGEPEIDRRSVDKTAIFELLARAVTRMAGGRPLLFLLEDVHGADVSVDALQYVARRARAAPILIVATCRLGEIDRRHPLSRLLDSFTGDRRFSHVQLAPLSAAASRALVSAVAGGGIVDDELADAVFAATEGNPFFTTELTRALVESGGIVRGTGGRLELSREVAISVDALPDSIHDVVERQIARLPEDLRELLAAVSVVGRSFDVGDLAAFASESLDLDDAIERLLRLGIVEEREARGGRLAFSSRMIRDVLYRSLPRRRGRALHRRYAERLEARYSGRLERVYNRLLYHYSRADAAEKAVEYSFLAARQAIDAYSARDAISASRLGLEFLVDEWGGDPALEGEARMLLAVGNQLEGDLSEALREAERAAAIFQRRGRPGDTLRAVLLAAEIAWGARKTSEADAWVDRGAQLARSLGDVDSLVRLLSLGATVANLRGDRKSAEAKLAEARLLRPADSSSEELPIGGTLAVAILDPLFGAAEPAEVVTIDDEEILGNVFEPLLVAGPHGAPAPALCERWESPDGGLTFRLRLKRDVRFSDGTPLTAAAVKASFERAIRRNAAGGAAAFAALRGGASDEAGRLDAIVVCGEHELEIHLEEPLPIYPAMLTDAVAGIAHVVEGHDESSGARVFGTGPFVIADRTPERILLERNEHFRGEAPRLDAVEFRAVASVEAVASSFRAGTVDLLRGVSPDDAERLARSVPASAILVDTPRKESCFVLFNDAGPVARHVAARRALAGVVRQQSLVWESFGRAALPAVGVIPPGMLGHDPGRKLEELTTEEATAALRSVGIERATFRAAVGPKFAEQYGELLCALFEAWAEIGCRVEVTTYGVDDYRRALRDSTGFDMIFVRWTADFDDPDNFTHGVLHSRHGVLNCYYASPELDELADRARVETALAVREALYRRFETALLDAGAAVPLFHETDVRIASRAIRGMRLSASAPFVNYCELGKSPRLRQPEPRSTVAGTVRVHVSTPAVRTLDPATATTNEHGETIPNVFEPLVRVDAGAHVVPWLAHSFEVEDGGLLLRFRLREAARFHDGRRLTARDVRYTFERLLAARVARGDQFLLPIRGARALAEGRAGDLEGFRILSASEFTLELEERLPTFAAGLTTPSLGIVPEGCEGFSGSWRDGCVGTGPFRVASFEPGRRLELERNPAYWRDGLPRCERLVFLFSLAPEEALAEFRARHLSIVSGLRPEAAQSLRRDPLYAQRYFEVPLLSIAFVACNTKRGALADRDLRFELLSRVDASAAVRRALGRYTRAARGFVPPGLPGYDATPSPTAFSPLPPEPRPIEIELTAAVSGAYMRMFSPLVDELVGEFERAGVRIRIVDETLERLRTAEEGASVDMLWGIWVADYPDTDSLLRGALDREQGAYGWFCGSEALDRIAAYARSEPEAQARHALYQEAERIIAREALLLPLFHPSTYRFVQPDLDGVVCRPFGYPVVVYEELKLK